MAYLVTFDSITLQNPEPFDRNDNPIANQTILLSGKRSVQMTTETALSIIFKCNTGTYSNITDLEAKVGLQKTLAINGTNFTKCVISSFTKKEWIPGEWAYEVGFVQDTTA